MSVKLNNLDILNNQIGIKKLKESSDKTELLELFASYIYMTNPDYKYNETYLKDMIPIFWSNLETYTNKVEIRDHLVKILKKIEIADVHKCKLNIVIDELWEIQYDSLSEKCDKKWKTKISDDPKLHTVDQDHIYFKFHFYDEQNRIFNDYIESKNIEDVFKLTKSHIESFLKLLDGEVKNG